MASFLSELPSISTILSAYASLSAAIMLFRTMLSDMVPSQIREYIFSKFSQSLSYYFSPNFTFIVDQNWQAVSNYTYRAVETYLPTIIGTSADSLLIGSFSSLVPHNPDLRIPVGCKITDEFQGMKLEWSLHKETKSSSSHWDNGFWYSYRLKCKKSDQQKVMATYLPHIYSIAQTILSKRENLHIHTYNKGMGGWKSAVFKHPATFATLAMDPESKSEIIKDLETFVQRKEFFQRVGRSWKRGYLLHGPPGTGKSSLVAAIANKLRYNIYDLQLQSVRSDAELRSILTSTTNRSILLVEDIDCSTKASRDRTMIRDEQEEDGEDESDQSPSSSDPGITLSGLLNFTDGLWSSFGDERLIIFTTNHKEKLDAALLRPGRIDRDVFMGYCTFAVFKQLANTYLQIDNHHLFDTIKNLLKEVSVTPAEVAQQLMRSDELQGILESFIEFLKGKVGNKIEEEN
ncbi:hypothetical protein SLEP1_g41292 [Rubroshorea leprosula]|uniref:AAA+ ATPase domain-containing protein n=1 Tax=Rubroshorea leprosula TaxID=152421 RepID=A0AAV5L6D6_9ROSI|nr:hypothetical protein SLEP1_g41292 [Rubroshorea leprosula]